MSGNSVNSATDVSANGWFYGLAQNIPAPTAPGVNFLPANRGLKDPIYTVDSDNTTVHFPGDVYTGPTNNVFTAGVDRNVNSAAGWSRY